MGRYSAPLFDDDNDDDCQAMDWTAIPDDEHAEAADNNGADGRNVGVGCGAGDSRSVVCYRTASSTNNRNGQGRSDGFSNSRRGEGRLRAGNSMDNIFAHQENEIQDATNDCADDNNCAPFLRVAGQYLELQSNHYLEQQLSQRKRKRIRTTMIVAVAIVAVVLKRHAPPPPPLWNQSPSVATSFFDDSGSMKISGSDPSIGDDVRGMTQHETWASYSRHLSHLVHHALAYAVSVAWYATSNAFCYAIEELRDVSVEFWDGNGNVDDESMWTKWKRKLISIRTTLSRLQTAKGSQRNSQAMADIQHDDDGALSRSPCPIRLPAAHNLHTHLPRGATTHDITNDGSIMEDWSSEEFLRQTIGTSLSPQNLALKVISEGIDSWGEALVGEAPAALVHKIATATSASPKQKYIDDETLSGWILPPAAGFLLVGPEGVGKLHTSRRIAHLFLGHCSEGSTARADADVPTKELDGVLEVIAGNYAENGNEVHPAKELIVDHIRSRKGLGSVIIIHHIELLPTSLLSDISQVISGMTDTISYRNPEKLIEATCKGTVFILTAKQWGKSIFQHIQTNGRVKGLRRGLRRESLLSSIRWEVDSHLDLELAAHATTAPFFPFEIDDLSSILQHMIQTLNRKYQGLYWKQLEVSHATIKYAVGIDHVEYSDLYKQGNGSEEEKQDVAPLLTFSTSGAFALDNNAFWKTLRKRLLSPTRRRPGFILKVDLDDNSKETVFTWCNRDNGDIESCEEEWRSLLT